MFQRQITYLWYSPFLFDLSRMMHSIGYEYNDDLLWGILRGTSWIEVTTALKSSLFFCFLKLGTVCCFIYVLESSLNLTLTSSYYFSFFCILICRHPAHITLLRGNHESRQLTQVCSFFFVPLTVLLTSS